MGFLPNINPPPNPLPSIGGGYSFLPNVLGPAQGLPSLAPPSGGLPSLGGSGSFLPSLPSFPSFGGAGGGMSLPSFALPHIGLPSLSFPPMSLYDSSQHPANNNAGASATTISTPSAGMNRIYQQAASVRDTTGVDPRIIATIASTESNLDLAGGFTLGIGNAATRGGRGSSGASFASANNYGGTQPSGFWAYQDGAEAAQAFKDYITAYQPALVPYLNDASAFFNPDGPIASSNYYVPTVQESAKAGGYAQATRNYYSNWLGKAQGLSVSTPASVSSPSSGDLRPSQFSLGLDQSTALAACGPASAIALARANGFNPDVATTMQYAKIAGWTPRSGMAGPDSEVQVLHNLGVTSAVSHPMDWGTVAATATAGRPLLISTYSVDTGGHYFYVTGFNPQTGTYHVGSSGTDLVGGSPDMTPRDMERLMGTATAYITA